VCIRCAGDFGPKVQPLHDGLAVGTVHSVNMQTHFSLDHGTAESMVKKAGAGVSDLLVVALETPSPHVPQVVLRDVGQP
jgi:hypothetical protein